MSSSNPPGYRPPGRRAVAPSDEEEVLEELEEELEEEQPTSPPRDPRLGRLLLFGVSAFVLSLLAGVSLLVVVLWNSFGNVHFNTSATTSVPTDLEIVTPGQVLEIDPQISGCVSTTVEIPKVTLPYGQPLTLKINPDTTCEFTLTIWLVPPPEPQ